MVIYQFRVASDDIEELVRVIQIRAGQTFLDFHMAIQESIGFDATKEAFFHKTTDNWRVEDVICSTESSAGKMLDKVKINQTVFDPHQKFIYINDSELEWEFHIELIRMFKDTSGEKTYPVCIKREGENPKQYKNPYKLGANPSDELFDEAEELIADRQSDDFDDLSEVGSDEV
jgi:hypothetical protein